jgi:uroporphyrinogen decarboxylase
MTDREWIIQALFQRRPCAVPYNFMFSPPALEAVRGHLGRRDVEEAIGLPIRMTGPRSVKPLYAPPAQYGQSITDEFGVTWSTSDVDRGSPIGHALHDPDHTDFVIPDSRAAGRFEHIGPWCRDNAGHYTIVWVGDLWERATFMRGMENLLLDVALNPAFVRRLLRGIADHILATMEVLFEHFTFDGIAVSDDYGTQKAMLISPRDWRGLIRPLLAEIYGLAKRHGRTVFHHSCGHIVPIIPDLIELGLDILHPIQPEAMDVLALKREFGKDLAFCGGLRTQDLLPRGTPREVREEVRRLKDELGRGGGYVLEPGITIQADVPLANILAMIDEAKAAG